MRDRQASAYQYPRYHGAETDLERRAEEAAYMAGKSVEDWLHDVILEQSTPANYSQHNAPQHNGPQQDISARQTKDAVLEGLADRVKMLEIAQNAGHQNQYSQQPQSGTLDHALHRAAENIGHNYDEDARILIEGIRARARMQKEQPSVRPAYNSRPESTPPYTTPPNYHDAAADRLSEMLNNIERLEQRLSDVVQTPPHNQQRPAEQNPMANPENTTRLARIEQQLESLEAHLSTVGRQYEPDMMEPQWETTQQAMTSPAMPRRKTTHAQGRRALQRAIETIADQQNGQQSDRATNNGYVPKNRTGQQLPVSDQASQQFATLIQKVEELKRENRASQQPAASDQVNQQFATLIKKFEELKRGAPTTNDINALKAEFTNLRGYIVELDAGDAKGEISRLRDMIQNLQATMVGGLDDTKLKTLEADINRVAEFLLQSPDLTKLPEQAEMMTREISRISDGLLAISDKNEENTRNNSDMVVGRLESSLKTLRDDIIVQLRDNNNTPTQASVAANDFESRMTDLRSHIDSAMGTISGKVDGIENKVASAAEKLENLGKLRNADPDVSQQIAGAEGRLVEAAKRLEQASVEAARSQGEMPATLLQMPVDAVTSRDLKTELDKLASHLSESLKTLKPAATTNAVTNDTLKSGLDELGSHLGQIIQSAQPSANALTPQQLKYELGGLADHLAERLKPDTPVVLSGGVTDDILKNELAGLAEQVTQSFAVERSIMGNHIDSAIAKLQMLAESQKGSFENIARQTAETVAEMTPQEMSQSPQGNIDIDNLQAGLNGLKSSTENLSSQTQSSFDSIQEMFENVTTRLNSLEEAEDALEKANEVRSSSRDEYEDEAITLSSEMRVTDEASVNRESSKLENEQSSPSMVSDEVIMERMRAHVKARHPDEQSIQPSADDVPLKPGAGKPALKPTIPGDGHQVKVMEDPGNDESADVLSPPVQQEYEPKQSKADFIAAARRAAQRAASEQVSLNEQEEQTETRSALSVLRERIGAVGKITKRDKEHKKEAVELPTEQRRSSDAEPVSEKETLSALGLDNDTFEAIDEPAKSNTRVRVLSALVAVALVGSGYLFLKEPVTGLVSGLSQNSVIAETALPPKDLSLSSSSNNRPEQTPTLPDEPIVLEEEPTEEVHTSLENDAGTVGDLAALDIAASGIDSTTTQAISPTTDVTVEPDLDPVLRRALEELPDDGISAKLADALIAGEASAFIEVARRFGQGDIFPRDIQKSAFWYQQAAEKENAVAQYRLGTLYEEGIGFSKDVDAARRWYIRATDNGNARAMHNLAVLYTEGAFGEPDFKKAFIWFERGASYGIKDSQFNLGILYVRGLGVKASLPQAYKWFDIVARGGDADAAEKRDDVAKALKPDQLEAIKKESASWKKTDWIVSANVVTPAPSYWRDGTEVGAAVLHKEQPSITSSSALVKEAQLLLRGLGFDPGTPDGVSGKRTKEAVRSFEYELGLPQTGKINQKLVDILKSQKI